MKKRETTTTLNRERPISLSPLTTQEAICGLFQTPDLEATKPKAKGKKTKLEQEGKNDD